MLMSLLITIFVCSVIFGFSIFSIINGRRANMHSRRALARIRRETSKSNNRHTRAQKNCPLFPKLGNRVWDESRAGKLCNSIKKQKKKY